MSMKNIAKSLVVAGTVMVAGAAVADMAEFCPSIGVDYYQAWMKGNKGPAALRGAFPKDSYPGATVYVAAKFMENFGVELGGDFSSRKTRNSIYNDTGFLPVNGALRTRVRRTGGHLDLMGFLPVADCTELFASLGVGVLKAKTDATVNGIGLPVSSKTKGLLRVGVGASYMVTPEFGVRAKVGFENTRRLTVTEGTAPTGFRSYGTFKPFANSTTLAVGVFYKFW